MLFRTAADDRPYHLGPFPLEALPRDPAILAVEAARPRLAARPADANATAPLIDAARRYQTLFARHAKGEPAPKPAPVPDDPHRRMIDVKGYATFMNAAQVGICAIPANAWLEGAEATAHTHAVVILVQHPRPAEADNPAYHWTHPAIADVADMRAAGIAVCLAGHIRQLGYAATAHVPCRSDLDRERLAVLAGLAIRVGDELKNPFLSGGFAISVVATDYALATDLPLAASALHARGLRYWLGQNGATSGRERNRQARRATHLSKYPMEQVKRVAKPTTLIIDEEVPRVPKRASFFDRALRGDLGAKAERERGRFASKQPHTGGMMAAMRDMVAIQDGAPDPDADIARYDDPDANSKALKSLSYMLGADLTGICAVPDYAWYSHDGEGNPIAPRHRYAVVMLIDQEYDTMEGASGDDWISGTQSMRAYLRGAEIAGIMAETLRRLGFPARSHTNVDSEVLHIPLVLLAGLGELSRIGELVLNPFVGPRFKSVVLTTDMPLQPDQPIDFGLQYFCDHCHKCARECPCDAISWGNKVMFNGYEMWKPDTERCARYRLTNQRGSACGRCMKTCPLNKVVTADGAVLERVASWCGVNARWLKPVLVPIAVWLDDYLGHGKRNPAKKWWFDLEVVDGVCVTPKGANQRDLRLNHTIDPALQKMAYYPASMNPLPQDLGPQPADRKAAMAVAKHLETPDAAKARLAQGRPPPEHYVQRTGAEPVRTPTAAE